MTATSPTLNGANLALQVINNPKLANSPQKVRLHRLLWQLKLSLSQPAEVCDLNSSLFNIAKTLFEEDGVLCPAPHNIPVCPFKEPSHMECQAIDFLLTLAMADVSEGQNEKQQIKDRARSLLLEKMMPHLIGEVTIHNYLVTGYIPYLLPLCQWPAYLKSKVCEFIDSFNEPIRLRSQELRNFEKFLATFTQYYTAVWEMNRRGFTVKGAWLRVSDDLIDRVLAVAAIISADARKKIVEIHSTDEDILGLIPHLVRKMWGNFIGYETIRKALLEPENPDPGLFPLPLGGPSIPEGCHGAFQLLMTLWPAWAKKCGAQVPNS